MGSVNITKDFTLQVETTFEGKKETITFDCVASMHDSDAHAVPDYDVSLVLQGEQTLLKELELEVLKCDLEDNVMHNFGSFKDGDIEEMTAVHHTGGLWDIDYVKVGSVGV